jgi:hypothetical protein
MLRNTHTSTESHFAISEGRFSHGLSFSCSCFGVAEHSEEEEWGDPWRAEGHEGFKSALTFLFWINRSRMSFHSDFSCDGEVGGEERGVGEIDVTRDTSLGE